MSELEKYQTAYQYMMMFWDSIPIEDREYLNEKLSELNL
jgi:hypothetical protein